MTGERLNRPRDGSGSVRHSVAQEQPLILNTRIWQPAVEIDQIDLRILSALENDGRISKSDLAIRVGLSTSACLERMRRLEKKKLVLNYRAEINVRMLSRFETFFAEITLSRHRAPDFIRFERHIKANPRIIECFALAGGIDYLIKIISNSVSEYQGLIDDLLEAELGVDRYFTYIVTKLVKSNGFTPISSLGIPTE